MVQARERARLPFEPRLLSSSSKNSSGRTFSATSRPSFVSRRPVDLSHSARPEGREDLVGPEPRARRRGAIYFRLSRKNASVAAQACSEAFMFAPSRPGLLAEEAVPRAVVDVDGVALPQLLHLVFGAAGSWRSRARRRRRRGRGRARRSSRTPPGPTATSRSRRPPRRASAAATAYAKLVEPPQQKPTVPTFPFAAGSFRAYVAHRVEPRVDGLRRQGPDHLRRPRRRATPSRRRSGPFPRGDLERAAMKPSFASWSATPRTQSVRPKISWMTITVPAFSFFSG